MPTICRLIQLSPEDAAGLLASTDSLSKHVQSPKVRSDVYRYWDAIQYLLAQHRPGSSAARLLALGTAVTAATSDIPGARVISTSEVQALDGDLRDIQPDDLIPHYDAAALDAAQIYPATWQAWEETFDPLGQVLEHYYFLQEFTAARAKAGDAMMLYFDVLAEGAV